MSRYRAGATWVRVWRTGTYNDFHLLPRKLGIEDRVAILSSSPVAVRRDVILFLRIHRYTSFSRDFLLAFCRKGGYLRKQRQGGGASDIHPRPRSRNLPLSLPLSWGGIAPLPPPPQRHPFCTLRPNDPAVARSCRQSSPEDSAIRTSALASFPRRVLRERLRSFVRFYNDFAMKIHLLE